MSAPCQIQTFALFPFANDPAVRRRRLPNDRGARAAWARRAMGGTVETTRMDKGKVGMIRPKP
jgi:hypothetical protein